MAPGSGDPHRANRTVPPAQQASAFSGHVYSIFCQIRDHLCLKPLQSVVFLSLNNRREKDLTVVTDNCINTQEEMNAAEYYIT